jgi:hypothetical protein
MADWGSDYVANIAEKPRLRRPLDLPVYATALGSMFYGDAVKILASRRLASRKGKLQLVFTSPPFPLKTKKRYGNFQGEEYIKLFANFAPLLREYVKSESVRDQKGLASGRRGADARLIFGYVGRPRNLESQARVARGAASHPRGEDRSADRGLARKGSAPDRAGTWEMGDLWGNRGCTSLSLRTNCSPICSVGKASERSPTHAHLLPTARHTDLENTGVVLTSGVHCHSAQAPPLHRAHLRAWRTSVLATHWPFRIVWPGPHPRRICVITSPS